MKAPPASESFNFSLKMSIASKTFQLFFWKDSALFHKFLSHLQKNIFKNIRANCLCFGNIWSEMAIFFNNETESEFDHRRFSLSVLYLLQLIVIERK